MELRIAYVDTDPRSRNLFQQHFGNHCQLYIYEDPTSCVRAFKRRPFHVVLAREELLPVSGVAFFREIEPISPDTLKVLLTVREHHVVNEDNAYPVIRAASSRKAIAHIRKFVDKLLLDRQKTPVLHLCPTGEMPEIIYKSADMEHQLTYARRIADQDAPILITGNTGTGKDLVAKYIHFISCRCRAPLQIVNCAAVNEQLFESEFFGHVKGAFTGASYANEGYFRRAHNGTLVLDEIGELSIGLQAKLLRAIDNQEAYPVGSPEVVRFNTRIVALTNRNIEQAVRQKFFREDLYYRLHAFHIHLKNLSERREDIAPLARYFLENSWYSLLPDWERLVSPGVYALLESLGYPGNVRDLYNLVSKVLVSKSADSPEITESDIESVVLQSYFQSHPQPKSERLSDYLKRAERTEILAALERNEYNITRAAKDLGLTRQNLQGRMKRLKIEGL